MLVPPRIAKRPRTIPRPFRDQNLSFGVDVAELEPLIWSDLCSSITQYPKTKKVPFLVPLDSQVAGRGFEPQIAGL